MHNRPRRTWLPYVIVLGIVVAIALGLVGFIALVFVVTVVNLQRNIGDRKAAEAAALATLERADPALPAPVPAAEAPAAEPAQ